MRVKFETVLFDFDGTIAESGEGIVRSARWAMEQLGKAAPGDDVLRRFVGPPLYESFQKLCGLNAADAQRAVELYRVRYSDVGLFEARIYPGIAPLLRALRRSGAWVAVASAKPEAFLVRKAFSPGMPVEKYRSSIAGTVPVYSPTTCWSEPRADILESTSVPSTSNTTCVNFNIQCASRISLTFLQYLVRYNNRVYILVAKRKCHGAT